MGKVWKVLCYRNGNRRGTPVVHYVRAASESRAVECGKTLSGLRYAIAFEYNPERDLEFGSYVRPVKD